MEQFKSGFVGLIGRTNVGKSTFINQVLGQKVTISTDRAQTTRERVNCIYHSGNSQVIFVDCPGYFKPHNLLGRRLNQTAGRVVDDSDLLLAMIDVAAGIGGGDFFVLDLIETSPKPKILLLNKIDLVKPGQLDLERKKIEGYKSFKQVIPVSAKTGYNVQKVIEAVEKNLPEGPPYFSPDMVSDQPREKLFADIIREKLALNLLHELPHSINVVINSAEETITKSRENIINIYADIYTEKKSQKAIVIGKSGRLLKKVGQQARKELEELLGCKVFLQLWVKVEPNWTKNEKILNKLGYY